MKPASGSKFLGQRFGPILGAIPRRPFGVIPVGGFEELISLMGLFGCFRLGSRCRMIS